jgi:hypothetical protein
VNTETRRDHGIICSQIKCDVVVDSVRHLKICYMITGSYSHFSVVPRSTNPKSLTSNHN